MKLFSALVVAFASWIGLFGALVGANVVTCSVGDDDYFNLAWQDQQTCIEPRDGQTNNGQPLVLSDCVDCLNGWRLETSGNAKLFHTSDDREQCLQAGHGAPIETLVDGSKMRIYPCDTTNSLQRFVWGDGICDGPLKLEGRDDLCVVFLGVVANVGSDPIILVKCDDLDANRAQGWTAY
jgi:hypothetical protein